MNVLITGGTGFLGQHLSRALLAAGNRVRVMGRNLLQPGVHDLVRMGAIAIPTDLRDEKAVRAACRGAEVLFHVGALSAPWGASRGGCL